MSVLKTPAPLRVLVLSMVLYQPAHAQFAKGMRQIDVVANDYSFFVFCNLKDKPDAPSHVMLGMYTAFHVE